MSQPSIIAEKLGKCYQIPCAQTDAGNWRQWFGFGRPPMQESWALRDVSMKIAPGEVIGIIGRNGSGKSTLLKILSRITEPTEGQAEIRGRLASLLEVGTGFHNELTGRENIWLAGAILGMRRSEVRNHFDEIVAFADIGTYLDTPVKHYSSGMYVRLAFAVAAHLLSDILLVDEVLAVGDIEFQKRCLRRMGALSREEGRTVLFVSHNLAAVRTLCSKVLWLKQGRVEKYGTAEDVLEDYIRTACRVVSGAHLDAADRIGSGELRFVRAGVVGADGQYTSTAEWGQPCVIRAEYEVCKPIRDPLFTCGINNVYGARITTANSDVISSRRIQRLDGHGEIEFVFDPLYLAAGEYLVTLASASPGGGYLDRIVEAFRFEVHYELPPGATSVPGRNCGDCLLPFDIRIHSGGVCVG